MLKYAPTRQYKNASRYSIYRQILNTKSQEVYLETANQFYIQESSGDRFHEVLVSEENRLDIISNNYYGTPDYYWCIAMANMLVDPFVVKAGTILRIPDFRTFLKPDQPLEIR